MVKKLQKIKLQIEAAKQHLHHHLDPLGQAGINIGDFVTKFNTATSKMEGTKYLLLLQFMKTEVMILL